MRQPWFTAMDLLLYNYEARISQLWASRNNEYKDKGKAM